MIKAKYSAAITDKPWWLAGSIPRDACIVAYQPVGASSLEASYTNLANPGIYTPTPDGNAPGWDDVNGWQFASASTQSLNCGFTVPVCSAAVTAIAKFTNATTGTNGAVFGQLYSDGQGCFGYAPFYSTRQWWNGSYLSRTGLANGVVAIAGLGAYENGALVGSITAGARTPYDYMHIGAWKYSSKKIFIKTANVQAFAYYDTVLTDDQIVTLTAAMNAL